jgi:SAM-dependent methyltransferase
MSRLTRWWRRRRRRILEEKVRAIMAARVRPSQLAAEDATVDREGLPIPPPALRERVAGEPGMHKYLDVGQAVTASIRDRFREAGVDMASFRRLADFGCGCARVARFLRPMTPDAELVGLDVDGDAIAWCRENLSSIGAFRAIPHHPPTTEPDGAFDALVAISVFTHLPQAMQRAWVAEWARLVAPGGHLLFSLHHASSRKSPIAHRVTLVSNERGSYYCHVGQQQTHPDWYQVTYHTKAAARRLVEGPFEVLRVEKVGIMRGQMSVVARRREKR